MKITKIKIDSMFGVEHLELDGKSVELSGIKGAGKTSVIDAIRLALKNSTDREYVIKNGANEAQIFIQTDTGLSIDRKKRTEKGDYFSLKENGKAVSSPQTFLNDIFTELQLNPIEFASWAPQEQNRAILDLIEFEWNMDWIKEQFAEIPPGIDYGQHILQVLDDIQAKNSPYWKAREDANRKELYKRQSIEEMAVKFPANYNIDFWKKYDLKVKSMDLQKIQSDNAEIEKAMTLLDGYKDKYRGLQADKDIKLSAQETEINTERNSLTATIERLKGEILKAETELNNLDNKMSDKKAVIEAEFNAEVEKLKGTVEAARKFENVEKIDTAELQSEIDNAMQMKEFVSEFESMQRMKNECEELKEISAEYDRKIKLARTLPGTVLEQSKLPIENMKVESGRVLVDMGNGYLPISNLSDGETIDLCVDISLAQKNNLQMILLNGVEQLDSKSRQKIYDKCKAKGMQIIAARTSDDNELQIIEL